MSQEPTMERIVERITESQSKENLAILHNLRETLANKQFCTHNALLKQFEIFDFLKSYVDKFSSGTLLDLENLTAFLCCFKFFLSEFLGTYG